jgi:hypothetical protein
MSNIEFFDKQEFEKELKRLENQPGIGQKCSICGIFYSFQEDPILRKLGICKRCRKKGGFK